MAQSTTSPLPPLDAAGNALASGSMVHIMDIPDWLTQDLPPDEILVLKSLQGTIRKIVDIDAYGYIWFGSSDDSPWFCLKPSDTLLVKARG